jgi:hypothetical protein
MKKLLVLALFFFSLNLSFAQYLPFAPVGAKWCLLYFCKPNTETHFQFVVTEDTVIQDKYCTRLADTDWVCNSSFQPTYVHWDSATGRVFRYDIPSQEFKLVLDYSKNVGESWKVELCESAFFPDTAIVTVNVVEGRSRNVTIRDNQGTIMLRDSITLWEGAGGEEEARRLLFYPPYAGSCGTYFIDYHDPIVNPGNCQITAETFEKSSLYDFNIYPNPTTSETTLTYRLPIGEMGEVRLFDAFGRQVAVYALAQEGRLTVSALPAGLYLASLVMEGRVLRTERLVKL